MTSRKVRRNLFEHGQHESVTKEMTDLIPVVLVVLKKLQPVGLLGTFGNLLRLISKDKFPFIISVLLLLDVVRWYSIPNTSKMIYSDACMNNLCIP